MIVRAVLAGVTASGVLLSAGAAPAQLFGQTNDRYQNQSQNVPFGSPLDQRASGSADDTFQRRQSPGADLSSAQGDNGIKAVEVQQERDRDRDRTGRAIDDGNDTTEPLRRVKPAPPSEFELYAARVLGRTKPLPRFGASLIVPEARDFATPPTTSVPPDYIMNVGDTIVVNMTGSIEGELVLTVDTDGRIFIPKVGPARIAGVRYSDLRSVLVRAIGRQFRDFRVTPSVQRLRGVRVYVTGYANNPGAYSVNSLSTLVNAVLAAGGPSGGGSFRSIKLYRAGQLVSDFDLYDFIRGGDKSKDVLLQNEDVLYIPAVGPQIAIAGSVNDEAIYEAKPGETLDRLIAYGGGFNGVSDRSRVMLYSIKRLDDVGGLEIPAPQLATTLASAGDIVQILSLADLARPLERQAVLVKLEGEVARPGNYYVAPGTALADVIAQAGGLTRRAFVYGMELDRVSVRTQQRKSFSEALDQLELSLAAAPLRPVALGADTGQEATQLAAARLVVDRLRQSEPTGRVILGVSPEATATPADLVLENNDRVYIPPRPTTVGVFGAVYRPGSFQLGLARSPRQYLRAAGGPLREADNGRTLLIRANGQVIPKNAGGLGARVLPGDVLFVPIKTRSTSILPVLREITSTLFSFGLTAAVIDSLNN